MIDPSYLALSKYRRRKFEEAEKLCSEELRKQPKDQALWYLKTKILTAQEWQDDTELEEEGAAELLLDQNTIAQMPRPGTSIQTPSSSRGINKGVRPLSSAGRPVSGFQRPSTGSRSGVSVDEAFKGAKPGTSRPITSSGRYIRLGTASMLPNPGGPFIDVQKIDVQKYAKRPALAKALCDYMIYHEQNPKRALELAAEATIQEEYSDWWWKDRLGKCYYQLGMLRDAEKQFQSSIKIQNMVVTHLELGKVYLRLDQPNKALQWYSKGSESHPADPNIIIRTARVYEMLNEMEKSVEVYKKALDLDKANVESIACIASNNFYQEYPELALRGYRRLLQMGVNTPELWNNLGLCCFYASQYDMTLSCFERALDFASDEQMPEIWYNIGQVAVGIGDINLSYQAFKIACSVNNNHAESLNNLGVLDLRQGNIEQAQSSFKAATSIAPHLHEPWFNMALLCYKLGNLQESFNNVNKALENYPEHTESKELLRQLEIHFKSV